ncbi:hypothetical protein CYY_005174 [Polysphondylium violaceum]|uniref:Pre-mRNA-processing factor 19 n=1 Tax=Polysphondylium violaceum TaxID=133409 RepID=A0A8J4PTV0_9MYCE|nr:hypothetical protein CYY_005174 [Polysphondylium violaceum]
MICSISGNTPDEAVVSIKTGNVYEKRLIEKYIETNGKEPTTGEPLSINDLVTVKVGKVVKPRPTTATSIPSMLQLFQNEWDSLMLETFTLKQQYETIRQELAHSLYQYDAACRVIARLVKERDIARNALSNVRHNGSTSAATGMDVNSDELTLPKNVQDSIQENSKQLFATRKKRSIPSTLPKVEDLSEYNVTVSVPVHSSTKPGILCLDIHKQNANLIVSGGMDQNVNVFNKSTQKIESSLQGHHKKVNRVKFHPTNTDSIFSCSSDKSVRVWAKGDSEDYKSTFTFKNHQDEVTDISVHPLGSYLLSASLDKSWNMYDVNVGQLLLSVRPTNVMLSGYTCANFHPDGALLATGNTNKELSIWDINSKALVANLNNGAFNSSITSMAFSENGYYLAVSDQNTVQLWDLRKQNHLQTLDLGSENVVKSISFDNSGSYLGVVGTDIHLYNVKGRDHPLHSISSFSSHGQHTDLITGISWSNDTSSFATTSLDRSLKVWSK